jgi:hypothetical protein
MDPAVGLNLCAHGQAPDGGFHKNISEGLGSEESSDELERWGVIIHDKM